MHSIRLASPWQRKWESAQQWERIKVPDSVDSGGKHVQYRRTFNRPTGLDSETAVWLVVEDWAGSVLDLRVNGDRMIAQEEGQVVSRPIRVAIERHLEPHNTIDITLATDQDDREEAFHGAELMGGTGLIGLVGPIRLELVDRSEADSGT